MICLSNESYEKEVLNLEMLANGLSDYLEQEDIIDLEKQGVKIKKKWGFNFLK